MKIEDMNYFVTLGAIIWLGGYFMHIIFPEDADIRILPKSKIIRLISGHFNCKKYLLYGAFLIQMTGISFLIWGGLIFLFSDYGLSFELALLGLAITVFSEIAIINHWAKGKKK